MRVPYSASHHNNLNQFLFLMTLLLISFAFLVAKQLEPKTSAREKESVPPPLQAGRIFIVNTSNNGVDVNPGDGLCDTDINTPGEQCSLRAAIIEANASPGDDAIRFELPPSDPGCQMISNQCLIRFSNALPDISSNIEFDGPGAKLLQILPSNVRGFRITSFGTVTFSGLTINGGVAAGTGVGGNVLNLNGGTVNIINCEIFQGIANAGGLIYNNSNGTVNITNSRLQGGIANNIGGAGIYNNLNGTVNVTNSSLLFNHASGTGNGGAIFNNSTGAVNVSNSTISSNTASSGGGIAGTARVKSTIIAGNTSTAPGSPDVSGAFNSAGFNLIGKRDGSTGFTAATDLTGTIAAPVDPRFGGTDTSGATTVLSVLCSSPAIDKGSSASLTGPLTTDQRGTGFRRTVDDPNVTNAAGGDGTDIGAFERQNGCNLTVHFTVNTTSDADDVNPGDLICDSNAAAGQQCSLRAALKELNLTGDGTAIAATINFAIPTSDPGFDPATGRFTITLGQELSGLVTPSLQINGPGANILTIHDTAASNIFSLGTDGVTTTISGMTMSGGRSSAIVLQANSTLNLANCALNGNIGTNGGAVEEFLGAVNISNCTFSGNSASSGPQSSGGAVWVADGNLTVTSSTFTGNSSAKGGAVSATGLATNLTIIGSTFNGNIAGTGGAIQIESTGSPVLNLIGSTLTSNTATSGGALQVDSGTANIINSTIFGNTASGTNNMGGGVVATIGTVSIRNSTIAKNSARIAGGIMSGVSTVTVLSSIIAGNTGTHPDVSGSITSNGFNLVGVKDDNHSVDFSTPTDLAGTAAQPLDPKLDPLGLQNNGGPTQTVALICGSPALDKGNSNSITGQLTTDQRGSGFPRTFNDPVISDATGGDGTDIGAFERQQTCAAPTPTPTPTPTPNAVQFSSSNYSVQEDCTTLTITVSRIGDTSGSASVDYNTSDVTATERKDYITALGRLFFAPGETSKSFGVLINEDSFVEGNETFNVNLSNPTGVTLGAPTVATVTIVDDPSETAANPLDDPQTYVCQHYHDFLNRQPDPSGLAFWINEITSCGTDAQCIEIKRINVSAAFYLSIEFQQTGYLVERLYKTAYGNALGTSTFGGAHQLPVPVVRLNEFLSDTQKIGLGVVVGQGNWEQILENNKQAFATEFVQRTRFTTAFPSSLTPTQFVDTLNSNAGNPLSPTERDQLVSDLTGGVKTRAAVLRAVAENADLFNAESNRAFVLMQYFGYLRRNPNDPQDTDYTGFDFWLTKLNQFNGNFIDAEMVKAFITSSEYRQRFGP